MGKIEWRPIDDYRVLVPKSGGMLTEGIVYATARMMEDIGHDESLTQVANVAHMQGIVGRSMAMPDIHWGYGFPIGGVAAFDAREGVVSPGGVGYDINCGVRVLKTPFGQGEVENRLKELVDQIFRDVPTGVGSRRKDLKLGGDEQKKIMTRGAALAVEQGFGEEGDAELIEDRGCLRGADPDAVSGKALERGKGQLGTLGSGNHFIEIGVVDEIFDAVAAAAYGLHEGQVTVMIHTGSRGLGHQVCDESIHEMVRAMNKYSIRVPDRQLCSVPIGSPEGRKYLGAMAAAANWAFANRQVITHWVRQSFAKVMGKEGGITPLYDVAHNIAKFEKHTVDGVEKTLCVHRKGATRAFGPGRIEIPERYREAGQPVLIPGDMGRCSFILAGTSQAMNETFGSACHGAGRRLSRTAAIKSARGRDIRAELEKDGILVRSAGRETLAEEMPEAYKDVSEVVDVVQGAGIAKKVARLKPMGVVKG